MSWRSSILALLLALIPCKSVHVVASCARESGSRIEAWSSCAVQLIGEEWIGAFTRRRTNAPTNAPTDAKQGDGYSAGHHNPPAKPDFQPNISSSVLDVLNNLTFGQAYDTFISAKHSDLRSRKRTQVTGVEGFCYDEAFSSKHCLGRAHDRRRRREWGHRAYNFVCSDENQIAWNHPDQKLYAHGNMGKECDGDPSFCKASICARYEDKNETRKVKAFAVNTGQDLEFPKGKWLSDASKQASLHFTVTCGVRSKLMICPLLKSLITRCSVKKECGTYSNAQPIELWFEGKKKLWEWEGYKGWANANTLNQRKVSTAARADSAAVWEKIKKIPDLWKYFDEAATKACSTHCGFF